MHMEVSYDCVCMLQHFLPAMRCHFDDGNRISCLVMTEDLSSTHCAVCDAEHAMQRSIKGHNVATRISLD